MIKNRTVLVSTAIAALLLSISNVLETSRQTKRIATTKTTEQKAPTLPGRSERQEQLRERANQLELTAIINQREEITVSSLDDSSRTQLEEDLHPFASVFASPNSDWLPQTAGELSTKSSHVLKVFVYDSLPAKYTTHVETCMLDLADIRNETSFSALTTKMADLALIKLFSSYPGRVHDASLADIFVVPYAHAAHCYCADGWYKACAQVKDLNELFDALTYYNETSAPKHLFLLSANQYFIHERLMEQPFKILGGNLEPHQVESNDRGTIVIPYLNDKAYAQRVFEYPENWWTRSRSHAFSFAAGMSNARTSQDPRKIRRHFVNHWYRQNRTSLASLPVHMQNLTANPSVVTALKSYHNAIFCPILAGDSAQQSRFFDVMQAGCIPVVLNFTQSNLPGYTSWYRQRAEATVTVYPFTKEILPESASFGIDYNQCVLAVTARVQNGVTKLIGAMENMILKQPDTIREIQRRLAFCARGTTFGMGRHAHRYNDAFAEVLQMIRHYLDST